MKLISANKLNRLWNNGVVAKMVAKTKILKTLEEIEANTNEENVAGATALKEVNNKLVFPSGAEFYLDEKNGERGFNTDAARGADTFVPFNRTKIVIECLKAVPYQANPYNQTFTYTAERDCILHIRGCGAHGGKIYGSGLSVAEGNYCFIYNGDIKLIKGQTYQLQCTISTNGGICCLGYID